MGQDRLAIIDLGSNTFHLLIVQRSHSAPGFKEIFRQRDFVYLSRGGIDSISPSACKRGLESLTRFSDYLTKYEVSNVICYGTATLRKAENGGEFIQIVKASFDIDIQLIDGQREAALIYKGVRLTTSVDFSQPILTMDVGGGSVEFILSHQNLVKYAYSINIGISELRARFPSSDPPTFKNHDDVMKHLWQECHQVLEVCREIKPVTLIGSSGLFEFLMSMDGQTPILKGNIILSDQALKLLRLVSISSSKERRLIKGMPIDRYDLSLESSYIMLFVLESMKTIGNTVVSPFAMKEGAISECYNLD